jgi:hypothetical protein
MDTAVTDLQIEAAQRPETTAHVKHTAPMTGAEFIDSLRDDREVYIYGERVKDVTVHPAFRNTARMIARMYDALHDPQRKDRILTPTDTGNGGFTHAYFKAPKSAADLLQGRSAIAEWARLTYGWIGRAPDYKASFLATLGANADFYEPYQDNARRWYTFTQERVPFVNHAIIHPPVDRDRRRTKCPTSVSTSRKKPTRAHRLRSKGRRDRFGVDQLHLRCASRPHSCSGQELRVRVHRPDVPTGRQVSMPNVVRDVGDRDGKPVRLPVVVAPG